MLASPLARWRAAADDGPLAGSSMFHPTISSSPLNNSPAQHLPASRPFRHPEGRPIRIVIVGDIGHTASFHVGDEAMTLALIEDTARAGAAIHWTALSVQPAQTARTLGIAAVRGLTFATAPPWPIAMRNSRRLTRSSRRPPGDWYTVAPPDGATRSPPLPTATPSSSPAAATSRDLARVRIRARRRGASGQARGETARAHGTDARAVLRRSDPRTRPRAAVRQRLRRPARGAIR